jgi:hypothetical protein
MKKTIAVVVIVFIALFKQSIAQSASKNVDLPFWVSNSFQRDFKISRNVSWEKINDIYVATFKTKRNEEMAYYERDGKLVGTGIPVSVDDLPEEITKSIDKAYHGYTIQKAVEYSPSLVINGTTEKENSLGVYPNSEGTVYFLHVSNAQSTKVIKVPTRGNIELLKEIKKA